MYQLITLKDALIVPLIFLIAWLVSNRITQKHIATEPYYKYFKWGLFAKLFAGLAFAGIYLIYYYGGDTTEYFLGTGNIVKLIFKDFGAFIKVFFGDHSAEIYSYFDGTTGWPTYWRDPNSFAVCRFNVIFYILSFGSYIGNTLLMNIFLYAGAWRFYRIIVKLYPKNEKWFAYALLFFPSVLFWSSGILKDGWSLAAILIILSTIYQITINQEKIFYNLIVLLIWSYIAIQIRPYIFYSAFGAGLVWIGFTFIKKVENKALRTVTLPFIIIVLWFSSTLIFAQVSELAGERFGSLDKMIEQAQIIQNDLIKDYYGENSFDIGEFEATIPGILKKAPKAIVAGIFRPFIWEARNPLMILSGLENLILLFFSVYIVFSMKLKIFFQRFFSDPFLISTLIFSLTYAFMVGLTTANFGALVRYRIPALPFYLFFLLLMKIPSNPQKTE